jgi:hypothetical protein
MMIEEIVIEGLILSAFPVGREILSIRSYRPDYLEYPALVIVRTPAGKPARRMIKTGQRADSMEKEAAVLRVLGEIGLPAPGVLAGPAPLGDRPGAGLVLSEAPGQPSRLISRALASRIPISDSRNSWPGARIPIGGAPG